MDITSTTHPDISPPKSSEKFAKIYNRGWRTITSIAVNNTALKVYTFIAEHCDHLNALVCPIEVLAEELDLSNRTIMRATKWLQDRGHMTIIKVGTANAYVLDARDIWKNYDQYKRYCSFGATTLISKKANKALKTRLTMMMEGQRDFFDPETGELVETKQ